MVNLISRCSDLHELTNTIKQMARCISWLQSMFFMLKYLWSELTEPFESYVNIMFSGCKWCKRCNLWYSYSYKAIWCSGNNLLLNLDCIGWVVGSILGWGKEIANQVKNPAQTNMMKVFGVLEKNEKAVQRRKGIQEKNLLVYWITVVFHIYLCKWSIYHWL